MQIRLTVNDVFRMQLIAIRKVSREQARGVPMTRASAKHKVFRPRGVEADGLKYYQEQDKAGDYLSIDPSTIDYYMKHQGKALYEGRATAIKGLLSSVSTGAISLTFLQKKCHRVRKADIPKEWLEVL